MSRRVPPRFGGDRPSLSVWATGQRDVNAQLVQGPYVSETRQDADRIPPAVAAYAIATYSRPGDTVLDPDCGAGTVLVEALRAARNAVGVTGQPRWSPIAHANLATARRDGARGDGVVLDAPPEKAAAHIAGRSGWIDLILTAWRPALPEARSSNTASAGPADARGAVNAGLRGLLSWCRPLLRPGGHAIVILPRQHSLPELPGHLLDAGTRLGLLPVERCIALLAELRGTRLVVRASLAQRGSVARRERATGQPVMLPAHQDVLIFQTPPRSAAAAWPIRPVPRRRRERTAAPEGRAVA